MTDEQINATIAKELGWTQVEAIHRSGRAPGATYVGREFIPDYCTDLNAMHEAEKVLDYEQCEAFTNTVADIVHAENREKDYPSPWGFARIHATARQRAEAFLLTLGKWSATDKNSLTVGATTEQSSAVQDVGWPPPGTRCLRINADGKWEEVQK